MAITLRTTKGSPLTHEELDANFSTLDAAVVDSGEIRTLIDSDYIISKVDDKYLDSDDFDTAFQNADIDNLSDGATNKFATLPNIQAIVDSNYVSDRVGGGAVDNAITSFLGGNLNTSIIPNSTLTYSLGDSNYRFTDMWLAGQTLHLGDTSLSVTDGGLVVEDKYEINAGNVPAGLPGNSNPLVVRNPTWDSSNTDRLQYFGNEVIARGNYTLVSSSGAKVYDSANATEWPRSGYTWLLDSNLAVLWEGNQAINDGLGESDVRFGSALALSDSYAYIGAYGLNKVYQIGLGDPYNTIDSISIPDSGQTSAWFGFSMSMNTGGTALLVGAPMYDSDDADIGRAYLYFNDSTAPFKTFRNPNPIANDNFGWDVSAGDRYVFGAPGPGKAAGHGGKVYTMKPSTGDNPWEDRNLIQDSVQGADLVNPDEQEFFGQSVKIVPNGNIVATSLREVNDIFAQGEAYIFDASLNLQHILTNPFPADDNVGQNYGSRFGQEMDANNSYAVVTAEGFTDSDDFLSTAYAGRAYVFDMSTGDRVATIENPNDVGDSAHSRNITNGGDRFGRSVFLDANSKLIIGASQEDYDNQDSNQNIGVIYQYATPSIPVDSSAFNGLFSATWTNDSGLTVEIDPRYNKELKDIKALNLNDVVSIYQQKLAVGLVDGAATQSAKDADGHVNVNIPLNVDNPYASPRWSINYKNDGSYDGIDRALGINSEVPDPIDVTVGLDQYVYVLDDVSNSPQRVYQYTMSSADSIATGTLAGNLSLSGGDNIAIEMDVDGRYLFTLDQVSGAVERYDLSTRFDITSGTRNTAAAGSVSEANAPTGFTFNITGTKMYLAGGSDKTIYQYGLSTPWDPSTLSYSDVSVNLGLTKASTLATANKIKVNPSGYQLFVQTGTQGRMYEFQMTAGDLSTLSFNALPQRWDYFTTGGFDFNKNGSKIFVHSTGGFRYLQQYSVDGPNYSFNAANTSFTTFYGKKLPVTTLAQIPFVADDPNDWSTVPKSVDDAVNRMSNLIKTLNGGSPIP